jgi:hypothetical protein
MSRTPGVPICFIFNSQKGPPLSGLSKDLSFSSLSFATTSVADPDPSDPYVFGPPGSGSFYQQAKIVRKTFDPTVL